MGQGIFGFFFETLRPRVNDPKNTKYWLPARLQALQDSSGDGPLLPVRATDWVLGSTEGLGPTASDTLVKSWWQSVQKPGAENHQPIVKPGAVPHLSCPQVAIQGLSNVYVEKFTQVTEPGNGYQAELPLTFEYYDSTTPLQQGMRPLTQVIFGGKLPAAGQDPAFQSTFQLTLDVCSAPKGVEHPTQCDGFVSDTIDGKGTFEMVASDVEICAATEITVVGEGGDRKIHVAVTHLEFPTQPSFLLKSVKITNAAAPFLAQIWEDSAKDAFSDSTTQKAMVAALKAQLNREDNLCQLSTMLTEQFQKVLNDTLGEVPPGELPTAQGPQSPNPVDQYVFDRFRYAVNAPSAPFFLPTQILKFKDPTLEPFKEDSVSLGDVDNFQDMELLDLVAVGLSNMLSPAAEMIFNPDGDLDSTLEISTMPPPPLPDGVKPAPLTATGKLTFKYMGHSPPEPADFVLTVKRSFLSSKLHADGGSLEDLVLTLKSATLGVPGGDPTGMIVISITNAGGMGPTLSGLINGSPDQLDNILQGLNNAAQSHLDSISTFLTEQVKKLISNKLD